MKKLNSFIKLGLILSVLGIATSCGDKAQSKIEDTNGNYTVEIPYFKLRGLDGNTYVPEDLLKGKVAIVDYWATWCGPCLIEIPFFIELYDKYKDQGFQMVGIALDEQGEEIVRPFAERLEINYPILIGAGGQSEMIDGIPVNDFSSFWALPTTFVIDRNGKIHKTHIGYVDKSVFEKQILELLDHKE